MARVLRSPPSSPGPPGAGGSAASHRRLGRVMLPRTAVLSLLLSPWPLGLLSGCQPADPVAPISPSRMEHTPIAGVGGVVYTPTPTPGPSVTPTVAPTVVREPPEPLHAPGGFRVGLFADQLGPVRALERAPNGDIFASLPALDTILVLPDRDRDGAADGIYSWFAGPGLHHPVGMAFSEGALWVANTDGVIRFEYAEGDVSANGPPALVFPLPGGGRNPDRSLIIDAHDWLYVGVGAPCNACLPPDQRAASVLRYAVDGSEAALYANGLRDPAGLAQNPLTGEIWLTDKARDDRGDDGPPDELNQLVPGGDYGWPRCTGNRRPDGEFVGGCTDTIPPVIAFPAHLAPTGLAFYEGDMFPEDMRDDLFVTSQGSTMRSLPIGYKLMRVAFEGGRPTGEVIDAVHGWLRPDTRRWGRPVDVEPAADGALLIADDAGGRVYRLFYDPPKPTATPPR